MIFTVSFVIINCFMKGNSLQIKCIIFNGRLCHRRDHIKKSKVFIIMYYFDNLQRITNVGLNDFIHVLEIVLRISGRSGAEETSPSNSSTWQLRRGWGE